MFIYYIGIYYNRIRYIFIDSRSGVSLQDLSLLLIIMVHYERLVFATNVLLLFAYIIRKRAYNLKPSCRPAYNL